MLFNSHCGTSKEAARCLSLVWKFTKWICIIYFPLHLWYLLFGRTACKVPAVQNITTSVEKLSEKDRSQEPENWNVKMLYDGECPLCMRECRNFLNIHQCDQRKQQVTMLRERNKNYGAIKFVDISSKEYSAEKNHGLDYATAFRRLYEEVGLGWVYAITKYEPVASIAGAVYALWAKYRLQITGRPSLENVLEERKKNMESCDNNSCRM